VTAAAGRDGLEVMHRGKPEGRQGERGAAGILFALALPLLVGIVAFVTDFGYAYYSKQHLQDTLDLASMAAARELDGGVGEAAAAVDAAQRVIDDNGIPLAVSEGCDDLPEAVGTALLCRGFYASRDDAGNLQYPTQARFDTGGAGAAAVRLRGWAESPSFFARIFGITALDTAAVSVAALGNPLTQLTIASTLASVDTSQSTLLSAVFSSLLGGSASLNILSYEGLATTQIDLLTFLDALAIRAGLTAGDYDGLAEADLTAGMLVGAAIDALPTDAPTSVAADLLTFQNAISASLLRDTTVSLADLLDVTTSDGVSGLDVDLAQNSAFDIVQASIQAANGQNALSTGVNVNLPGVGDVRVRASVIEPQQTSAVGGVGIHVATAQTRVLVSVGLPADALTDGIEDLLDALLDDLVVSLGLVDATLGPTQVALVDDELDIYLELAPATGRVSSIDCGAQPREVGVIGSVGLASVQVGKISAAQEDEIFSPSFAGPVQLEPINILGATTGVSLKVLGITLLDIDLSLTATLQDFENRSGLSETEEIYESDFATPQTRRFGTAAPISGLVSGLTDPVPAQVTVAVTQQTGTLLGGVLVLLTTLINTLVSGAEALISDTLGSLISGVVDPLVTVLTQALGIQLGAADITVNFLQCGNARLVN